jgi:predicted cupin superfamily sugar epimerase
MAGIETVPARIASTAIGLLQSDEKSSNSAWRRLSVAEVMPIRAHQCTCVRVTFASVRATTTHIGEKLTQYKNIDEIWVSNMSQNRAMAARDDMMRTLTR